jgi:hypothetical protein
VNKIYIALSFILIGTLGCEQIKRQKNISGWPQVEQDSFITTCLYNASRDIGVVNATKYCSCVLDESIKEYTSPDEVLNESINNLIQLAKRCL